MKHPIGCIPSTFILKVDLSSSKTTIIQTPTFEWYVVTCGSKNERQFQRDNCLDWIMCSKDANHSKFNSQHDLGGKGRGPLTLNELERIFNLIMEKKIPREL